MTKAEMFRRLRTLTAEDVTRISSMIRQGFGAHGISLETPFTIKQINAVFQFIR